MVLDGNSGSIEDRRFPDLIDLLSAKDLLIFNDTRVIPARLYGRKASGGRVEILLERLLPGRQAWAQIKASKAPGAGTGILLDQGYQCRVLGREHDLFRIQFAGQAPLTQILDRIGHIPLPPYIDRPDQHSDRQRYQTVYARNPGAVAAPTAGLHFDAELLAAIRAKGVTTAFVTLHVGAGTFQPLRVEDLDHHRMHSEVYEVDTSVVEAVARTRQAEGRVIAVGTTVVRSLESACQNGELQVSRGETRLFIRPGFKFQCVDAMVTNFHLPESTLLMLVCAFAGYDQVMRAYRHAVAECYRFFSYGDAMFITPQKN